MYGTTRLEMELGGKSRPLLFDHRFFDFVTEGGKTLNDLDELQVDKPWRFVPTLALAALQSGSAFEGKKDKFTYDQVVEWTRGISDPLVLNQIVESYKTALGFIYRATYGLKEAGETVSAENQ